MDNSISIFKHETFGNVRVQRNDGELMFIAKDVAEALGYEWNGKARIAHVPEVWRGVTSVVTPSGTQDMLYLTEQGLYFFIGRSDKPAALPFQMWVAGTVLPAIRKDGGYIHTTQEDDDLTIIAKAHKILQATIDRLQGELEAAAPKTALADSYLTEGEEISVGSLAKKLQQEGIDMGQNRLFEFLRNKGVLINRPGITFNTPTQKYAVRNWFRLIQPPPTQHGKWKPQIRVTPKGVMEISKRMHELFGADME